MDVELRPWVEADAGAAAAGDDRLFGAFLDGQVVGAGGLHRRIGPRALDLGYWVHAAYLRRGIATAIARRLCAIAFAEPAIGRVEIRHDPRNEPSGAVARAARFEPLPDPDAAGHRVWRLDRSGSLDMESV